VLLLLPLLLLLLPFAGVKKPFAIVVCHSQGEATNTLIFTNITLAAAAAAAEKAIWRHSCAHLALY
jgi:hypothetical protein